MSLRNKVIRLAYQNPSLRKDLLPLLKTSASTSKTIIHEWLGDLLYRENPARYGFISSDRMYYIRYNDIYENIKEVDVAYHPNYFSSGGILVAGDTIEGKDFHLDLDVSKETKSSASKKIIQFLKAQKLVR